MIWAAIVVTCLGLYALKLAGLLVPGRVLEREPVRRATLLLPIALLAALVATQTLVADRAVGVDARVAGVGAAVVALVLRAPFLVVVLVAAGTAAAWRAVV